MKNFNNCINTEKLEELRIKKGYSINKLCFECKMSHSTYKKILDGKKFNLTVLYKIARILNANMEEFFT